MADARTGLSPLHRLGDRLLAADEAPAMIRLAELPFLTQLTLRVAPDSAAAAAAAAALGAPALPGPNAAARAGETQVLWLGPDEWLVVGPHGAQTELEARLCAAVEGTHATVVDVSGQRTVIEVAGAAARDVLAKGCALDLHPRSFGPERCAQTALARTGVVLLQRDDEPAYWVFVRASFAEYLAEWLLDASAEARGIAALDLGPGGPVVAAGTPG
jgi:sarcosine oxidase subunit gamma